MIEMRQNNPVVVFKRCAYEKHFLNFVVGLLIILKGLKTTSVFDISKHNTWGYTCVCLSVLCNCWVVCVGVGLFIYLFT